MLQHTPPMGWNSWNTFGTNISDQLIREVVCTPVDKPVVLLDSSIKTDGDYNVQVSGEKVLVMSKELKTYHGEYAGLTKLDRESARLMLVVGTNVSRQSHENWEKNLSLALKLHVLLERQIPGIMRPMNLRSQRFNQDLSPGALLVEVGAAGNTHTEAHIAAEKLAEAIIALAKGTN